MAVPKRRKTKSKAAMRRASNWRLEAPAHATCPQCRQPKLPHRVCKNCGYYAGRQAIETR